MKSTMAMPCNPQNGFTLIEIAIVLVIIGLLLGGVLQGQQLIENSRVNSTVNDFNRLATMTFSYQDRYGRLPGDDPGAIAERGDSWNLTIPAAGDGDGAIDADLSEIFHGTNEVGFFFQNLRSAGYLTGNPEIRGLQALPQNPFGGLITVTSELSHESLSGLKICMGNISGSAAITLDTQLDDGDVNRGRFRATNDGDINNAAPSPVVNGEPYLKTARYTVCFQL